MQANREQLSAPSRRFLLEIMLLGTAVGVGLLLLDGPLWLFYVAPFLAVPLLVLQLRGMDPAGQDHAQRPLPLPRRPGGRQEDGKRDAMSATPGAMRTVPSNIIWLIVFAAVFGMLAVLASGSVNIGGSKDAQSLPKEPPSHKVVPPSHESAPQTHESAPQTQAHQSPELAYGGGHGGSQTYEEAQPHSGNQPYAEAQPDEAASAAPSPSQRESPTQAESKTPSQDQSEAGAGSSPLVPILIAVVVLAAIGIGVVLYRQRRVVGDRRTGDRLRY